MVVPTSLFSTAAQNADPSHHRYLDRCTHCTLLRAPALLSHRPNRRPPAATTAISASTAPGLGRVTGRRHWYDHHSRPLTVFLLGKRY